MSDPIITSVRAAWENQVRTALTITGDVVANVSGWFDEGEKFPRIQLVEDTTDSVALVSDYGKKYAVLRYIVVVEESGREGLSAAKRMDRWVSWEHPWSVFAALAADRTLGGVLREMDIAEAWTITPELRRAELPVVFYVDKNVTIPAEEPEEEP